MHYFSQFIAMCGGAKLKMSDELSVNIDELLQGIDDEFLDDILIENSASTSTSSRFGKSLNTKTLRID